MKLPEKQAPQSFASCKSCADNTAVQKDSDEVLLSPTLKMKHHELQLVERYRKRKQTISVSVIMPTWNRKNNIKRAIDSVIAQSYQNFQLIISDDGSTDGTGDYLRREYGKMPQVSYLYNEHRGVSCARNNALEQAEGQLVAYLDSDNQWGTNYLMVMVNALADAPDKSAAYCGIRVINEILEARFTRLIDYDRSALLTRNYIDMNVFIHQKNLYDHYGGFASDLPVLEDWELILRYTQDNPPLTVKCCLAYYYIKNDLNHLTISHDAGPSYQKIRRRHPK